MEKKQIVTRISDSKRKDVYACKKPHYAIRIKVEKHKSISKYGLRINKEVTEPAMCGCFATLVSEYCNRNGCPNNYCTYDSMENRYFEFNLYPDPCFDSRVVDITHIIEWIYPYLDKTAEMCGYEGLEVAAL